jgi:hypothetical protein
MSSLDFSPEVTATEKIAPYPFTSHSVFSQNVIGELKPSIIFPIPTQPSPSQPGSFQLFMEKSFEVMFYFSSFSLMSNNPLINPNSSIFLFFPPFHLFWQQWSLNSGPHLLDKCSTT